MSTTDLDLHLSADPSVDGSVRRRIAWIWALLFLNVLSYAKLPMVVPIPSVLGKLITQGALWLALLLALMVNRRGMIRPNLYLFLGTALGIMSLIVSLESLHLGTAYRGVRLIGFLATLWLLTPWFGRRDLLLVRCHLRCLMGVLGLAVVGAIIAPSKAFTAGRLGGVVWPIPATQLAHYAAIATGIGAILWMSGLLRRNVAIGLVGFGVLVVVLTHTRTALLALIVAVLVASASLFFARRRVRKTLVIGLAVVVIGGAAAFPLVSHWLLRGESTTLFTHLSGRTVVWHDLVNAPRTKVQMAFGTGLSNDSFQGLSIDDSWLAIYQNQGLVGDALAGLFLIGLLFTALTRPRGAPRALALFLLTYCIFASYTEVGLGDASTYLLDLTVAASLLMYPATRRKRVPALSP